MSRLPGLKSLRRRIDALDDRILDLLDARAQAVRGVYARKLKTAGSHAVEAFVPGREAEIVRRLEARAKDDGFPKGGLRPVFAEIISACRAMEIGLTVAYFGEPGSNTHQAARGIFGSAPRFQSQSEITGVFEDVARGRADVGVVPVENSTEGMVSRTFDLLADADLKICAEASLPIRHLLLGRGPLARVRRVLSHPQALAQTRHWLSRHLPRARPIAAESTSAAAKLAAADASGATAAVASRLAARLYAPLKVLASDIQDQGDNATRFFAVGRVSARPTGHDKTSIVLGLHDRVGALATALKPFQKRGVNLTSIGSRPSLRKAWEYRFFMDFMGHQDEPRVARLLADLRRSSFSLKVLGSYPAASALRAGA